MTKEAKKLSLNDFEEYRAASAKLGDLTKQLGTALKQAEVLEARIIAAGGASGRSRVDQAALALIGGKRAPESAEALRERHAEIGAKLPILKRACELQRGEAERVRRECSAEIIRTVKPQHVELVKRVARALVELTRLNDLEAQFRDDLKQGDIVLGELTPVPIRHIGHLTDAHCLARVYCHEAQRDGYLTVKEVAELLPPVAPINWANAA